MRAYVIISTLKEEINPCTYIFYKHKDKQVWGKQAKFWLFSRIHHHKRLSLRIIKKYVYSGETIIPIPEMTIEEVKYLFEHSHTSQKVIRIYGVN